MKKDLIKVENNLPTKRENKLLGKHDDLVKKLSALKEGLNKIEVIPRIYNQLVLFVLDGSRSMKSQSKLGISKAQEIHLNVQEVLDRLRKSKNMTSFDIGAIVFSDESKDVFGVKGLKEVSESQSFNSVELLGEVGDTYLSSALVDAERMIEEYFSNIQNGLARNALILLMTDGMVSDYEDALAKAEELKLNKEITICVTYFDQLIEEGSKWYSWNEKTGELDYSKETPIEVVREKRRGHADKLKHFASKPDQFMTSIDAEGVRNHMIKSISDTSQLI